ncbi:MAG: hypothetical protein ACKVVP_08460 [Chloroflexota bacterium]
MHWTKAALLGAAVVVIGALPGDSTQAQEMGGSSYPGPYYLGAPDAPVTFEEYADFQ